MRQTIPVIAAIFSGLTFATLVSAALFSFRAESLSVASNPISQPDIAPAMYVEAECGRELTSEEFDPRVAVQEAVELRMQRGSILAGSVLAGGEDPQGFSLAVARRAGDESLAPFVQLEDDEQILRRTAIEFDRRAERFESQRQYKEADELRALADQTRQIGRRLSRRPEPIETDGAALPDENGFFFTTNEINHSARGS